MNEETLFHLVLQKPKDERGAFLDEACAGDAAMRQRLDVLLRAHETGGNVLDQPPVDPALTTDSNGAALPAGVAANVLAGADSPPTWIGPYKLLETLGEGGMGTVYLAEQEQPIKRRVALKIIKAGMDSAQVIARFEAERQALAVMDHPNIAKVFDAGTIGSEPDAPAREFGTLAGASGSARPYFVMELVQGIPITKYCDQEHLTPKERLELFIPVCQAVQHAHQKGIIHRDLKPSNVLVGVYDGKPTPKVIDFGVAKATAQKLTERTMFTEVGQIVGTLEYMAPEQAELTNLDIDTRADIYSLGVILYELLTGSPPFTAKQLRSAGFVEMLRMIREVEPPKPSTKLSSSHELPSVAANRKLEPKKLTRLVQGELDWIVMKCLEKERGRRYETANGLAMDVQRYLADEPVLACPPSAGYRLRKFVRRNKRALAIGACLLLAATITAISAVWQIREEAAHDLEVRNKATQLEGDVEAALREAQGLHEQATAQREKPPQWHALLQAAFSAVTRAEALLAGEPELAPAGQQARVQKLRAELDAEEKDRRMLEELDRIELDFMPVINGDRLSFSTHQAADDYRKAFHKYGIIALETSPVQAGAQVAARPQFISERLIAALDNWSSTSSSFTSRVAKGEKLWLSLVLRTADKDTWRQNLRTKHVYDEKEGGPIDIAQKSPASLIFLANKLRSSVKTHDARVALLLRAQQQHPGDFWINHHLGDAFANEFWSLREISPKWGEAVRFFTAAAALRPENPQVYIPLGAALARHGELDAAIAAYKKALAIDQNFYMAHIGISDVLLDKKDLDGAIAALRTAIAVNPEVPGRKFSNGHEYYLLGRRLFDNGDFDGAITAYRKAIGPDPSSFDMNAIRHLGLALAARGDVDEALAAFQTSAKFGNVLAKANLGDALCKLGKFEEAEGPLKEASRSILGATLIDNSLAVPYTATADYNLALVYASRKNWNAAIASYSTACALVRKLSLKEDFKKAIAPLEAALEAEPKHREAYARLAERYLALEDYEAAVRASRRLVELAPTSGPYQTLLGRVSASKGDLSDAATVFQKAADLEPTNAHRSIHWFYLASVHATAGNRAAHQQVCANMIKLLQTTKDSNAAQNVISACVFWPDTLDDMSQLVPLAELVDKKKTRTPVLARALYRAGQYESSVKRLEETGALDAPGHFFLAMGHYRLGNKEKARDHLQKGIKQLENTRSWPMSIMAEHMRREAEALFLGIDLTELAQRRKKLVVKAAAADPAAAEEHRKAGQALIAKNDFDGAIAAYRKALDIAPKDAATHVLLGAAHHGKRDYAAASVAYRQALDISPENVAAYNGLGVTLLAQKDLDGALTAIQKGLAVNSNQPAGHYNLGNVWFAKRDFKQAITAFEKVLSLQPNHVAAQSRLLDTFMINADHDKAAVAARKLVEMAPKVGYHHYLLGNALYNKKDMDEAIACFRKAIELDPKVAASHMSLGSALSAKGELEEAITHYRRAVALSPTFATAHYNLGNALRDHGDPEGAIAAFRKAIALQPGYAQAHCNLGISLQRQGDFAEAVAALRRGHELGSKLPGWSYPSAQWLKKAERWLELDGKLAVALDKGADLSKDEKLEFGQLCTLKRWHATAARLYAQVYAEQKGGNHFAGIQAAVLAGTGQGIDAAKSDDNERLRWRQQALTWLQADLAVSKKQLESSSPKAQAAARQTLQSWLRHPDFRRVRGEDAINQLPESERAAWRQLWSDVAALLAKASGKS